MWSYIKSIFEGGDGQLSLRRLIALVFIALIIYMVIKGVDNQFLLYALYSLETTLLLLISVITTDNIITFFKGRQDVSK